MFVRRILCYVRYLHSYVSYAVHDESIHALAARKVYNEKDTNW